ncbi:anthranilate N-methyltransferase-like [Carica papaya]|uniref:anthranilate N-methyltransferase-like n=1 Tax=Carica papaya TaxID=3649 RepID=UPI000B8C70E1|nr:anthranilate N-methyltransferase-like [Carica papaya]
MDKEKQEIEAYSSAMDLVLGSMLPMTMQSAIELGIFKTLSKADHGVCKLSASQIVDRMFNCKNSNAAMMLDQILKLLASHGVMDCCVIGGERFYSLNPVSKYFMPDEDGFSLVSILNLVQDAIFMKSWYRTCWWRHVSSVPRGDAIFMKSDEHCLKLLKNCHHAIPNDGKVVVMDSVFQSC